MLHIFCGFELESTLCPQTLSLMHTQKHHIAAGVMEASLSSDYIADNFTDNAAVVTADLAETEVGKSDWICTFVSNSGDVIHSGDVIQEETEVYDASHIESVLQFQVVSLQIETGNHNSFQSLWCNSEQEQPMSPAIFQAEVSLCQQTSAYPVSSQTWFELIRKVLLFEDCSSLCDERMEVCGKGSDLVIMTVRPVSIPQRFYLFSWEKQLHQLCSKENTTLAARSNPEPLDSVERIPNQSVKEVHNLQYLLCLSSVARNILTCPTHILLEISRFRQRHLDYSSKLHVARHQEHFSLLKHHGNVNICIVLADMMEIPHLLEKVKDMKMTTQEYNDDKVQSDNDTDSVKFKPFDQQRELHIAAVMFFGTYCTCITIYDIGYDYRPANDKAKGDGNISVHTADPDMAKDCQSHTENGNLVGDVLSIQDVLSDDVKYVMKKKVKSQCSRKSDHIAGMVETNRNGTNKTGTDSEGADQGDDAAQDPEMRTAVLDDWESSEKARFELAEMNNTCSVAQNDNQGIPEYDGANSELYDVNKGSSSNNCIITEPKNDDQDLVPVSPNPQMGDRSKIYEHANRAYTQGVQDTLLELTFLKENSGKFLDVTVPPTKVDQCLTSEKLWSKIGGKNDDCDDHSFKQKDWCQWYSVGPERQSFVVAMLRSPQNSPSLSLIHSGMQNEWNRLGTFVGYIPPTGIFVIPIAMAGFFLPNDQEGQDNASVKVECAFCGVSIVIRMFFGKRPIDVHREQSSGCRFARGESTGNISIAEASETVGNQFLHKFGSLSVSDNERHRNQATSETITESRAGFQPSMYFNTLVEDGRPVEPHIGTLPALSSELPLLGATSTDPVTLSAVHETNPGETRTLLNSDVTNRTEPASLQQTTRLAQPSPLSPQAATTGSISTATTAAGSIITSPTAASSTVTSPTAASSSITSPTAAGSTVTSATAASTISALSAAFSAITAETAGRTASSTGGPAASRRAHDVSSGGTAQVEPPGTAAQGRQAGEEREGSGSGEGNENSQERQMVTYEDLGIYSQRPKRLDMVVKAIRIGTFNSDWPHPQTHTPEEMADAGFYFTGHADLVRCFHCRGGLKTWEQSDRPWIEHCRWFPRCPFVKLCKGPKYVEAVQKLNSETRPVITEEDVVREIARIQEEERRNLGPEVRLLRSMPPLPPEEDPTLGDLARTGLFVDANDSEINMEEVAVGLEDQNEELRDTLRCKMCQMNEVNMLFLPCGHLVACAQCAPALRNCAICRQTVKGTVRVNMDDHIDDNDNDLQDIEAATDTEH